MILPDAHYGIVDGFKGGVPGKSEGKYEVGAPIALEPHAQH